MADPTAPLTTGLALAGRGAGAPLEWIHSGGPVLIVLLAVSVVAVAIVLLKLWQFRAAQIGSRAFVDAALRCWNRGERGAALAQLAATRNPIARAMEVAIDGAARADIPAATVREEVERVGRAHLEQLRIYLRGLEVIAALSPLLGLLGTVLGMIEAFQQLEAAGTRADPGLLSGGIWEALLTTAAGLSVAIPAVVALNWIERIIERLGHDMSDAVTRIFTAALARPVEPTGLGASPGDHAD